jgi:hypothetical protein
MPGKGGDDDKICGGDATLADKTLGEGSERLTLRQMTAFLASRFCYFSARVVAEKSFQQSLSSLSFVVGNEAEINVDGGSS